MCAWPEPNDLKQYFNSSKMDKLTLGSMISQSVSPSIFLEGASISRSVNH